ncbi:putative sulfate exporter family transporter, partial [Sulfitobacter sp. HI0040]
VIMLAPVVVVAALVIRTVASAQEAKGKRPPLVPIFVIGFVALAALRSTGLVPEIIVEIASEASRWLLVVAIASVGLKTQPKDILNVGLPAVALLVAETAFLAALVGIALGFLPLAGAG